MTRRPTADPRERAQAALGIAAAIQADADAALAPPSTPRSPDPLARKLAGRTAAELAEALTLLAAGWHVEASGPAVGGWTLEPARVGVDQLLAELLADVVLPPPELPDDRQLAATREALDWARPVLEMFEDPRVARVELVIRRHHLAALVEAVDRLQAVAGLADLLLGEQDPEYAELRTRLHALAGGAS